MARLNDRQRKFAEGVASGLAAVEAYKQAGYSPRTAESNASRLMENEGVKTYLEELRKENREMSKASREQVQDRLFEIGMSEDKDRVPAFSLLCRMQGYLEPEKLEVDLTIEDALAEIIKKNSNS